MKVVCQRGGAKNLLGRSNLLVKEGSATSHMLIWECQNTEGKKVPEISATLASSAPIALSTPNTKGCLEICSDAGIRKPRFKPLLGQLLVI